MHSFVLFPQFAVWRPHCIAGIFFGHQTHHASKIQFDPCEQSFLLRIEDTVFFCGCESWCLFGVGSILDCRGSGRVVNCLRCCGFVGVLRVVCFFAFEKDRVWCGTGWALNRNKFGVVCRGFQLFLALNRRGIRGGARVRVHACVRP